MRWLVLLAILSLASAGCSTIPLPTTPAAWQEQQQFIEGLDQLSASNRVELLQQLVQDAPDSLWGKRAQTIILYVRELDTRKQQLTDLRKEEEQLRQETESLKQENIQLTDTIDQLKGLLIEQENRSQ